MSADQLRELLPFLRDKNPQVRQIALQNLLGHTPKEAPLRSIFLSDLRGGGTQDNDVLRDLKILCRDHLSIQHSTTFISAQATAHDAFRALVNLSDDSLVAASLSEPSFIQFLVAYILNPNSILADLASMILSNITSTASTGNALIALEISVLPDPKASTGYYPTQSRSGTCAAPVPYPSGEPEEILALPLLVDAFIQGANVDNEPDPDKRPRKASLHFLSSVFANISITSTGRMYFLTARLSNPFKPEEGLEYPLAKLQVFTEHRDTIRRGGTASTMKNCAFHKPAHKAMLLPDTEKVAIPPSDVEAPSMNMLPYLLLPLAGPEEYDLEEQELLPFELQFLPQTKRRELDPVIRLTYIEVLLLLCTTFWGREYLRGHGVYEVVRALHNSERDDKISEHIVRLVAFLKRDEGDETKKDSIEDDIAMNNSDDEDNQIIEI
ncbi:uncharacterized protein PHACADRAFT_188105 [Phanerochaete carnosa HHB-10118-sp]|uniref:Protein HGH1 homolog n=1 Tax=Phanerochaete carnosa (strain HHB-10118-sp) TaxID=650164 RepID=K5VH40_PHACS|nr:uncharacterized protein PHACADRAFT_188105 [Phanerochaete carnosa HHB-10118-sp]EKM50543.1 hypothetical protein PHACADRAFT_188105 [Phanerochaete carnosa HHB-10118-sp]